MLPLLKMGKDQTGMKFTLVWSGKNKDSQLFWYLHLREGPPKALTLKANRAPILTPTAPFCSFILGLSSGCVRSSPSFMLLNVSSIFSVSLCCILENLFHSFILLTLRFFFLSFGCASSLLWCVDSPLWHVGSSPAAMCGLSCSTGNVRS